MPPWLTALLLWFADSAFFWFGVRWIAQRVLGWRHVGFIPSRAVLERVHPVSSMVDPKKYAIHGLWITGSAWLDTVPIAVLKQGAIRQVLLPHPDKVTQAMQVLTAEALRPIREQIGEIRRSTKIAQQCHLEVRWLDSFFYVNLTFVNPEKTSGYVMIEQILPPYDPALRFNLRLQKKTDEDAFNALWRSYRTLWDYGAPPAP